MHQTNDPPRWLFYLHWTLVPLLCMALAFVLDLILLRSISGLVGDVVVVNGVRHSTEEYVGVSLFFPLAGLVIGTAQAALLRPYLAAATPWVVATLGGWLLGAVMTLLFSDN